MRRLLRRRSLGVEFFVVGNLGSVEEPEGGDGFAGDGEQLGDFAILGLDANPGGDDQLVKGVGAHGGHFRGHPTAH